MKGVLESLQSYLGRFSESRKPSKNEKGAHALDAGYGGGYGFPLLIRRSKGDQQEKLLFRKGKTGRPSSCHRCMHSRLTNSEPNLSPSHCNKSPIDSISSPTSTAARIKVGRRSMGLRDRLVDMYSSRRVAARRHAGDQPFDIYSSEYYSCGKKRAQNRRSACKFLNVDCACGVDVSAYSSNSDTEVSSSSCAGDNVATQVSEFSIILAENKALVNNCCHRMSEATSNFNTNDDGDDAVEGANDERDVGFCSQHESNEEESSWDCSLSALSLSPIRGALKKTFPPPLTMLALQSYSLEACAASHCLRSFRQDGRIVLQEVKAPIHKYFRVLREHGRLKLELVSAADDSSQEDDDTSASNVCVGVKRPKAGLGKEELCTSGMHAENSCEGTLQLVSMHSETSRNGGGSDEGCDRTDERMSTHKANTSGVVKPLEQVELVVSDIQSRLKLKLQAADLSGNGGASADERMLEGKLLFTDKIGAEDLVSCLNEPASSPRCVETTTLYDGPSARMKHSWVRPISAF